MDPRVLDPGHAPTPFSAEEIKLGCPESRTVMVQHNYPNRDPEFWTTVFENCGEVGPEMVNRQVKPDGTPLGPDARMKVTWDELQAHASFPLEDTSIEEVAMRTPLGELECLLYTVSDGVELKKLWFAKALPGLPVRTQQITNGLETGLTMVISDSTAPDR